MAPTPAAPAPGLSRRRGPGDDPRPEGGWEVDEWPYPDDPPDPL